MNYSKAIKQLRKAMHITQKDLAEEIGFNVATLNRWEGGKFEPSSSGKRKLAPYFKMYGIEVGE